jgi:hypothetical protein
MMHSPVTGAIVRHSMQHWRYGHWPLLCWYAQTDRIMERGELARAIDAWRRHTRGG